MDEKRWKQLRSDLLQLQVAAGLVVVLLGLACYLLWRILDALTP